MTQNALQKQITDVETGRAVDPNMLQRRAADPDNSVWVNASAGSGKTKVLTDRVLRLLLPRTDVPEGTPPHKILCITFTKAGANEMALRLRSELAAWAVLPVDGTGEDKGLRDKLESLLGHAPSDTDIQAARTLFAKVVDAPGGLNIMTIHAFCQSVLGRFPLEAGLSPGFTVMEEAQARALLISARDQVLRQAKAETASPLAGAVYALARQQNEEQFMDLLGGLGKERDQLQRILQRHNGVDGFYTALCAELGIPADKAPEDFIREACANQEFDNEALRSACRNLLTSDKKSDIERGTALQNWLDHDTEGRVREFESYKAAFIKKTDGEIYAKLATKSIADSYPETLEALNAEAARISSLCEDIRTAECAELTRALFTLGEAVLERYSALKAGVAALDFDDLILRTRDLLKGETTGISGENPAAWVLYKLDQGLDHILIDEAQDTNPEQWEIMDLLADEFFTGAGARDIKRTLFKVGDKKQSIFGFQRAAPTSFDAMAAKFEKKAREGGLTWDEVPMNISFRSSKPVLEVVDAVFKTAGIGAQTEAHESFRYNQSGHVELWPVFETQKSERTNFWDPPVTVSQTQSGAAQLAEYIGLRIENWIGKEELPSRGRTVEAGDIMILVRTRTAFVTQLTRALKTRNIPVSGIDRMVLTDQLAVQDLLALADFVLLPADDLSLACILKSPLLGWDENRLYELAATRAQGVLLWEALRQQDKEAAAYLQNLIDKAGSMPPYEFFAEILQNSCPGDAISGWRAVKSRLGEDALDPLDEFLGSCLVYEQDHIPGLQGFIQHVRHEHTEIKREMEEAGGHVRIMTVHSAKGLQAPIVILPDTTGKPTLKKAERLLWPDKTGATLPLWSPRKELDCHAYRDLHTQAATKQDEEYRRLLYVAMTRAEDRLYISGYTNKSSRIEDSWYGLVEQVIKDMDTSETNRDTIIYRREQTGAPDRTDQNDDNKKEKTYKEPKWLSQPAPEEPDPPAPLVPSRPAESEPAVSSPLSGESSYRFRRGNVTHKLLEILPELPGDRWETAALDFVKRYAGDLPESVQQDIVKETLDILQDPTFTEVFAPGSQAEVPVTGLLKDGRLISGQIDRLTVTDSEVLVIDYKTNRPPPQSPEDVPEIYKKQMQAYRDTLAQIYPGRAIKCALLWTDGPRLMPLDL